MRGEERRISSDGRRSLDRLRAPPSWLRIATLALALAITAHVLLVARSIDYGSAPPVSGPNSRPPASDRGCVGNCKVAARAGWALPIAVRVASTKQKDNTS